MNQELYLLKKQQRKEQAKKRSLIDTSILSENFFYKKLTNYDWFNKSKIIASFLSIKSEISTNDLNQYLNFLLKLQKTYYSFHTGHLNRGKILLNLDS